MSCLLARHRCWLATPPNYCRFVFGQLTIEDAVLSLALPKSPMHYNCASPKNFLCSVADTALAPPMFKIPTDLMGFEHARIQRSQSIIGSASLFFDVAAHHARPATKYPTGPGSSWV